MDIVSLVSAFKSPMGQPITKVMGIVTDVLLPPVDTRTGEKMLTFTLLDLGLSKEVTPYNGIKVRVFKKFAQEIPAINAKGDVILLTDLQAKQWGGSPMLMSTKATKWIVFPGETLHGPRDNNYLQGKHKDSPFVSFPSTTFMPDRTQQIAAATLKANLGEPSSESTAPSTSIVATTSIVAKTSFVPTTKFTLIQDANIDRFYDLTGEVIKKFNSFGGTELYVTDYTTNSLLFNYPSPNEHNDDAGRDGDDYAYMDMMPGGKRKWPGPYGSMTLKIELREPHSTFADHQIKEGDFIHLWNVRIKLNKMNKMEGNLWTDQKFPNKILLSSSVNSQDARVLELKQRKAQYTRSLNGSSKRPKKTSGHNVKKASFANRSGPPPTVNGLPVISKDPSLLDTVDDSFSRAGASAPQPTLSKLQKKRQLKKLKKLTKMGPLPEDQKVGSTIAEAPLQRDDIIKGNINDVESKKTDISVEGKVLENVKCRPKEKGHIHAPFEGAETKEMAIVGGKLNRHVRCIKHNMSLSSLLDIIATDRSFTDLKGVTRELPFINQNRWARVRVIDFHPQTLDQFAVFAPPSSSQKSLILDPSSLGSSKQNDWEWNFMLLVEEASGIPLPKQAQSLAPWKIWLKVTNDDAEFLLNESATNLKSNPMALNKLREKLSILWGNLEERKSEATSAGQPYPPNVMKKGPSSASDPELSNIPFDCCIKEYGIELQKHHIDFTNLRTSQGYARTFGLNGITIM